MSRVENETACHSDDMLHTLKDAVLAELSVEMLVAAQFSVTLVEWLLYTSSYLCPPSSFFMVYWEDACLG